MKTILNVKTDKEVKRKAQEIAQEIGLPLSSVVNAYLKEFVRERSVQFSIEPKIRPEVGKLLKQAHKDYKKKRNSAGPFRTTEKMDAYLDAI